jgi:hypothetical protein
LQLLRGLGQVMAAGLAAGRDQLRAAVIAAPAMHALRICARHALLPGTVQVQRFATQAHNPSGSVITLVRWQNAGALKYSITLPHPAPPPPRRVDALIRKSFDL